MSKPKDLAAARATAVGRLERIYREAMEAGGPSNLKVALDAERARIDLLGLAPPTVADVVALARLELAAAGIAKASSPSGAVPSLADVAADLEDAAEGSPAPVPIASAPPSPAVRLRLLREERERSAVGGA